MPLALTWVQGRSAAHGPRQGEERDVRSGHASFGQAKACGSNPPIQKDHNHSCKRVGMCRTLAV